MQNVTVTRMDLLARKQQIELAEQGLELLQQKRAALMRELMQAADRVMADVDELNDAAQAARLALAHAESMAGTAAVRSAALAARSELALTIETTNIMGVHVPMIEQKQLTHSVLGRGYALAGTSVTIDEAASAYEALVERLLEMAESQLRLQRLADEIRQTSRRTNALEHVTLLRLKGERDYIERSLEERERAEHFRLKRVKKAREKSRLGK
jgi:V/A-type H+-transporting ATPase subunit D